MSKKLKVNRINEEFDITLEDVCLDGVKYKPDVEVSYYALSKPIFILLVILISLLGFSLFFRSFKLQIVEGEDLTELADNTTTKVKKEVALRGPIYDVYGREMIKNKATYDAAIIPSYLYRLSKEDREKDIAKIVSFLKIEKSDIEDQINDNNRFSNEPILVKKHITHQEAVMIRVKKVEIPAIDVVTTYIRDYLTSPYTSHILGYLGRINEEEAKKYKDYLLTDYIGKSGIEAGYEDELHGQYGEHVIEIDARGTEIKEISSMDPVPGSELVLNIDSELQKASYNFIQTKIEEEKIRYIKEGIGMKGPEAGSVIVMDANTGGLLTLVSFPSYDSNLFAPAIDKDEEKKQAKIELLTKTEEPRPMVFRAISGRYASGSVIKPLVGLAGLEEGVITRYTAIPDYGGRIIVGKNEQVFRDSHLHGSQRLDIVSAISQSSNIYFHIVAGGLNEDRYQKFKGLGIDKLSDYLHKYGLGQETGLDIAGEKKGLVPDPEWKKDYYEQPWYLGDTYNVSIGQGDLLVTPLQVATYTGMIANGGTLHEPHLVKEIRNTDGTVINIDQKIYTKGLAKEENVKAIQDGMRKAAKEGTGRRFADLPVNIHSKTGTAQSPGGDKTNDHSWVTSYAKIGDRTIVVTVMIENGGYGSETAIPIAKQVYQWMIDHYISN